MAGNEQKRYYLVSSRKRTSKRHNNYSQIATGELSLKEEEEKLSEKIEWLDGKGFG